MAAEWAAYDPQDARAVEAFAAGVNAYVAEVRAGKRPLPVEFSARPTASRRPGTPRTSCASAATPWSPTSRPRSPAPACVCAGGLEADALRRKLEPAHKLTVPEGPRSLRRARRRARRLRPRHRAGRASRRWRRKTRQADAAAATRPGHRRARAPKAPTTGRSPPSRTATGRADPGQRSAPRRSASRRCATSPTWTRRACTIIGAGEPALPGVSIGHNGTTAFGITIFYDRSGGPLRLRDATGQPASTATRAAGSR